ncbi:hypothetical protein TELCIR_19514, partial [Teladorsagia circumcincta]
SIAIYPLTNVIHDSLVPDVSPTEYMTKTNELNAPLFITWFQCVVTVGLCFSLSFLSKNFPHAITFPRMTLDAKISREILPLSLVFVGMIAFNNLCLKHVGVSFYYLGRCLTTVFNVATSALTHNISGTAKAAAQTVMAVVFYSEIKTLM